MYVRVYWFSRACSVCPAPTLLCAIYITQLTNSLNFFLASADQRNEFLACGGGVVYACFVLFVMWAFFYVQWEVCESLSLLCVCVFDWPGSCLLALVDVMAIKLVVCSEGTSSWHSVVVLINSLGALKA